MPTEGLITIASNYDPKETIDRLAAAVTTHGMAILARIDHAAAAAGAGLDLRPTEVLIFGNPRAGTPLMQAAQTMGIDLPLRALVWQDEGGRVWLSYNDPHWLARRHGATTVATDNVLSAMANGIASVAREATGGTGPEGGG
jgi:uncharacterized protein (DUF302 family)